MHTIEGIAGGHNLYEGNLGDTGTIVMNARVAVSIAKYQVMPFGS